MMRRSDLSVRIYYEDVDLAGVVYYANYLKYFERGRTELLRGAGVEQSDLLADEAMIFVVRRVEAHYKRPAVFDDLLRVETEIAEVGAARVLFAQRAALEARAAGAAQSDFGGGAAPGAVLVSAEVEVVALKAGRPARLPPALRARLEDAP